MLKFTQMRKGYILLIVTWFSFNQQLWAQSYERDSASRKWYIPTGVIAEFAGGFGMLSAGILYHPTKKSEVALTAGYTPPEYGDIWTVNLLASRTFLKCRLSNEITIDLINAGLFINANFGDNIYVSWPERYYKNYYWWN